jgi:hypothetical protein
MSQFDLPNLIYYVTLHVSGLTPIISSVLVYFFCLFGFYEYSEGLTVHLYDKVVLIFQQDVTI